MSTLRVENLQNAAGSQGSTTSEVIPKSFTTPTFTVGTSPYVLSHSLGRKPIILSIVLEVVVAVAGYDVGDELAYPVSAATISETRIAAYSTTTSVGFLINSSTVAVQNKTTGVAQSVSNTNFRGKIYYA